MFARSSRFARAAAVFVLCASALGSSLVAPQAHAKDEVADLARMTLGPLDFGSGGFVLNTGALQVASDGVYDDSISMLSMLRGSEFGDVEDELTKDHWSQAYAIDMEHADNNSDVTDYEVVSYVIEFASEDDAAAAFTFLEDEQPGSGGTDVVDDLPKTAAKIGSMRELTEYGGEEDEESGFYGPVNHFSFVEGRFLAGFEWFDYSTHVATAKSIAQYAVIFSRKVKQYDSVRDTPLSQLMFRVEQDDEAWTANDGYAVLSGQVVPVGWDDGGWLEAQQFDSSTDLYSVLRRWIGNDTSYSYEVFLYGFTDKGRATVWYRDLNAYEERFETKVDGNTIGDQSQAYVFNDNYGNAGTFVVSQFGKYGVVIWLWDTSREAPDILEHVGDSQIACLSGDSCLASSYYPGGD